MTPLKPKDKTELIYTALDLSLDDFVKAGLGVKYYTSKSGVFYDLADLDNIPKPVLLELIQGQDYDQRRSDEVSRSETIKNNWITLITIMTLIIWILILLNF